jgi:hypothetical protein
VRCPRGRLQRRQLVHELSGGRRRRRIDRERHATYERDL